jgi:hypothetical protein
MVAFSQDIFDRICERIAEGESLREICEEKDMPARVNFIRWLEKHEALRNQYARARELQADHEFDEIKAIADLASVDDVQVARLRVDTRKWRAGKLRPKVYGDKVDVEHGGTIKLEGVTMGFVDVPGTQDR